MCEGAFAERYSTIDGQRGQKYMCASVEPVAIVGMACRLPGDVRSPSQLWKMLMDQRSGQCGVPKNRWNVEAFYHPNGVDRPGSMNTAGGYFLQEDVRAFENSFFGINNLEATYMDPQQRKLLEVVFECFENAGVKLEDASGSNTGCYVGNFTMDFLVMQARDPEYFHRYTATGMGTTILANRVSHIFNLHGPSMVLDTACSSSLYSLHTAVAALRNGDCDAAVVAGANLAQLPEQHMATMKAGVLSGTSSCHTFDSSADGYGRAEGVAALYIKRLDDAVRDGDPIRSIIRATAVNANGKTSGITSPSASAQEAVVCKAHRVAGLDLKDTAYVECHGTGTSVGDPIEVKALSQAFAGRPKLWPLLIGGVKPNFGHSEAASGITSIIKACLILESGLIPATIGVHTVNPAIKTDKWQLEVVTQHTPWPLDAGNPAKPRRIGVNAFGYGGANAHAVLEATDSFLPPSPQKSAASTELSALSDKMFLLPFSATSISSLKNRVDCLDSEGLDICDLSETLSSRRSRLPIRGFLITSQKELKHELRSHNLETFVIPSNQPSVPFAFVFTGQGAQWAAMGKGLIEQFPLARATIQRLDTALEALPQPPPWTLLEILTEPPGTSKIHETTHSQPACTAIQIVLVDILASWNVDPAGVVGHSSGEIAAAYAAGILTAEQAVIIAYYRGYVVGKSIANGQMMAVGLSQKDAEDQINEAGLMGKLVVACVNSPISVTLSGDADLIDAMYVRLGSLNVFRKKLITGGRAYHSHHMVAIGQEYEELVSKAMRILQIPKLTRKRVDFASSVTTQLLESNIGANYWRINLESPVLFYSALQTLQSGRNFQIIELGPHAALKLPISQLLAHLGIKEADQPYYSTLSRDQDSATSLLRLMGNLFLSGVDVSFQKVNSSHLAGNLYDAKTIGVMVKDLAPYQWTYDQILWNECRASEEFRNREYPRHEILGSMVVGGNLADRIWRNVLHLRDVPWLSDHKLGQTVVFPAAAFVAMAIEAMSQTLGRSLRETESIELQDASIITALTLSNSTSTGVELFTTLCRQPLTAVTKSKKWWHFEIVSVKERTSVLHATGIITFNLNESLLSRSVHLPEGCMENSAIRKWYIKLAKQGLNFGPLFRSIKSLQIHLGKSIRQVTATTTLLKRAPGTVQQDSSYYMHPITIDAMIQAGIISTSSGIVQSLQGQIPVAIERAIFTASPAMIPSESCSITANAEITGVGKTKLFTELYSGGGHVYAQMSGIRMVSYEGASEHGSLSERCPMLRVIWKPDIYGLGLLSPDDFSTALDCDQLRRHIAMQGVNDESRIKILVALDLITHKSPGLRILQIGDSHQLETFKASLAILRSDTAFPRFQSFAFGILVNDGISIAKDITVACSDDSHDWLPCSTNDAFDLIVCPEGFPSTAELRHEKIDIRRSQDIVSRFLAPKGLLLLFSATGEKLIRPELGYQITSCQLLNDKGYHILAHKFSKELSKCQEKSVFVVVEAKAYSTLGDAIFQRLSHTSYNRQRILLDDVTLENIRPRCKVIVTVEADSPLLSVLNESQMTRLKCITDNAATIVWITSTALKNCENPDTALVGGLSRALMLEQPSLNFFTLDVDGESDSVVTAQHVVAILAQAERGGFCDFEFVQRQGILNVSRFIPDETLNEDFRQRQGGHPVGRSLRDAKDCRLIIKNAGQFDTLMFVQELEEGPLKPDFVEVEVVSVGLNAKDFYVLAGKTETRNGTCGLEYSGIVKSIGSLVKSFAPGDRVVVMAPHHFKLVERAPQWACLKMMRHEDFNIVATLCIVYSTAIYGLHHCGHIKAGESVLIHSASGGLGIAAIQIAKLAGANIFATASSPEKRDYLSNTFGIDSTQIYNSRDSSFLNGVLKATAGRGVDIVLNSLTGDLLHDSWRACAEFGRFIEVGKKDILEAGSLNMKLFSNATTFTAFDLTSLYYSQDYAMRDVWSSLMTDVMNKYRTGQISAIKPLEVFDVSRIEESFRHFRSENRVGKIAVSMENPDSVIKVLPFKHRAKFFEDKTYLLVGCLGGIGGAIARWMISRGARKLVFLGRSGIDRPSARRLVEDLRAMGADITVVRGDVTDSNDVRKAIDAITEVLGGIIQAAMGLDEALFSVMSVASWHKSIDPKLKGTWNIHNAIADRETNEKLDFFLMTSSISGSVGTATESNYCSANYFLDAFARYRQSRGLQATSLGLGMISEVGYLHENPEIEALLLRKGIQAINHDELLQIVDLALCNQNGSPPELSLDPLAASHILTGLEQHGLKEIRNMGFEGNNLVLDDPRASLLASALGGDETSSGRHRDNSAAFSTEFAAALKVEGSGKPLRCVIEDLMARRFSSLTLVPLTKVDMGKRLAAYGIDSMLAAEFRTWIYRVFKMDIPFLELLSAKTSLADLVEIVEKEVEAFM